MYVQIVSVGALLLKFLARPSGFGLWDEGWEPEGEGESVARGVDASRANGSATGLTMQCCYGTNGSLSVTDECCADFGRIE